MKIIPIGAMLLAAGLAACSASTPQTLPTAAPAPEATFAPARGEVIGTGPVRVALLLPLSGGAASVGRAIANGARLGMEHALATGGQNVHLVLKDSGAGAGSARAAAAEALAEGAELILGPLTADAVAAAGAVAKGAGVPLIGFSSTAEVAAPGVYLLSVLPEAEIVRALGYARAQGKHTVAALIPDTALGRVQAGLLRRAAGELGLRIASVEMFADEAAARSAVERLVPLLRAGQIDALYLPDRATAPSFGILLGAAQVPKPLVLGSADWEGDGQIAREPFLAGAVYPALDPAGLAALAPTYEARFGAAPHPFATFGFSAALLANNALLSRATPRYGNMLLSPAGFSGRDGPFRFHFDGRGEYGLALRQVRAEGAITLEPARLGGLTQRAGGGAGTDAGIPPAAEFR